ncbi:MAG: glycine cleavage T C-terminal barrel domain-containing protein [Caldilineales bacterium]
MPAAVNQHPLSPTQLIGYEAVQHGAALRDEGHFARLWLGGADRSAFLQRISSNDIRLQPGQGAVTVLTSPTARIQAVLTVLAMADSLLLLGGPNQGPALFNTLRTQIFFKDQVELAGRGGALAQFSLIGPAAARLLSEVAAAVDDLALWSWRSVPLAATEVIVQRHEGLGAGGFTLLLPAEAGERVRTALLHAGAVAVDEAAYHIARIEAGVPAPGSELSEQVTPLEAGLGRFCSASKGCYTGQEIIARQLTYDKVATHLVGLLLDAPAPAETRLLVEGKPVGWLSSVAHSIVLDRAIALGFVRRPHHQLGSRLALDNGSSAQVSALPFVAP